MNNLIVELEDIAGGEVMHTLASHITENKKKHLNLITTCNNESPFSNYIVKLNGGTVIVTSKLQKAIDKYNSL